jgi:hypothetical protein
MKVIVYINFVLTLLLIGGFAWLVAYQSNGNVINTVIQKEDREEKVSYLDGCGEECKKEIKKVVSESTTTTIKPTEVPKATAAAPISSNVSTKKEVSYIPITGPITSTSSSWYDAPGTDFYLNLSGDYGKNATVTWDAFLKVAHGNGTAYARLFDVTHGIAVNGSEVAVTDKADLTQVTSGGLSFWSGNNLYRVQIKSLNTFEITFGSGRLKINY